MSNLNEKLINVSDNHLSQMAASDGPTAQITDEFDQMIIERANIRSESVSSQKERLSLTKRNSQVAIERGTDPIKITWKNLSYNVYVSTSKEEKAQGMGKVKQMEILKDCTGYANPG